MRLVCPAVKPGSRTQVSAHAFTNAQVDLILGDRVRSLLGDDVADAVAARFADAETDEEGNRVVDLGEWRPAVLAVLREISLDAPDPSEQEATENLIKALAV